MKKNFIAAMLLLFIAVGGAFACNDANYHGRDPDQPWILANDHLNRADRAWMDVGDPSDPFFDPLLMKHSLYIHNRIAASGNVTLPNVGWFGTGQIRNTYFTFGGKLVGECSGDTIKAFVQDVERTSYHPDGNASINVVNPGVLIYGEGVANKVTGNLSLSQKVAEVYPVKPRFPDIRAESFWPANLQSLHVNGRVDLEPGVHYFDHFNISAGGDLRVKVRKGERTVVYFKGSMRDAAGTGSGTTSIRAVDAETGAFITADGCDTKGQLIFIIRGCVMFTQSTFNFESQGTFISLGLISLGDRSKISGQVLADRFNSATGQIDFNRIIPEFVPIAIYGIETYPMFFHHDKFWAYGSSGTGNNAQYFSSIDPLGRPASGATPVDGWSATKSRGYDSIIVVSLTDPIKEGIIELKYTLASNGAQDLEPGKTLKFSPTKDRDTIRVRITDHPCDAHSAINLNFTVMPSSTNKINPAPTSIPIFSDDNCEDEIPVPEPDPIIPDKQVVRIGNVFPASFDEDPCGLEYDAAVTITLQEAIKDATATVSLPWSLQGTSIGGTLHFNANRVSDIIPLKVSTATTLTIVFGQPVVTGDAEMPLPSNIAITVAPLPPQFPHKPQIVQQRVVEYYQGLGPQLVGTLTPAGNYDFILSDDANGAFMIQDNLLWVTSGGAFKADYDKGEREISIKVKAQLRCPPFTNSGDTTIAIKISPWNNKVFEVKDFEVTVDERTSVLLDVLSGNVTDGDEPQDANLQKILGLTNNRGVPSSHQRSVTTALGANVSVENDVIKYDISHFKDPDRIIDRGLTDVFFYTVRDTADYGYPTDTFDESVQVTVNINRVDPIEFDLKIITQIDADLRKRYPEAIKTNNGIAVLLDVKGPPITNLAAQKVDMKIFDHLGNLVKDGLEINSWEKLSTGDGIRGIAAWDGKNNNKRSVAPGSYLIIIEAEIHFDTGQREIRTFRRPAMIRSGNK